ncbi:MAG: peptidoglycan editing factor PgeF [Deinococcales bacterium]
MWQTGPLESKHGFSQRLGGVGVGVYYSLNLSSRVGDNPIHVAQNRQRALAQLGLSAARPVLLRQIHSNFVVDAAEAALSAEPVAADALVSDNQDLLLVIETADCYPVLLEDRVAGVVAAAHCGWRGTAGRILENTIVAMQKKGAALERLRAAIGPGICAAQYPVRLDVLGCFADSGFPLELLVQQEGISSSGSSLFHLDLAAANMWLLESLGVPPEQIWLSKQCSTGANFFSYRRDHGQTGRMWAVIRA